MKYALEDLLNRVRQPFNTSLPAQAAAEAALDDKDFLVEARRLNRSGREQLTAGLRSLGLGVPESLGNFVLVDLGRPAMPASSMKA